MIVVKFGFDDTLDAFGVHGVGGTVGALLTGVFCTVAVNEAGEGLLVVEGEFATATPQLLARAQEYQAALEAALNFTKPQFNESMRSGHANM